MTSVTSTSANRRSVADRRLIGLYVAAVVFFWAAL